MNHDSSGRFDISDPDGIRIMLLKSVFEEGNGFALWQALRLCSEAGREYPGWVREELGRLAGEIIDTWSGRPGDLIEVMDLREPKHARSEVDDPQARSEAQKLITAYLPEVIDKYAVEREIKTQTAIKELAPAFGFPGEQWTRLRDTYRASKTQKRI